MKYTNEVFQRLSHGQFISNNSISPEVRAIFNDIEDNEVEYREYFEKIDFMLESGDGYYYFSRKEAKVITENKLKAFIPWIDYLDFLLTYDNTFNAGTTFTIAQIEVRLSNDLELSEKLKGLFPDKKQNRDKLEALATAMVNQGYAEVVNEVEGRYQVTMAFKYLTGIIECLNIDEEVKDEIPE